jgi:hypothetical protein
LRTNRIGSDEEKRTRVDLDTRIEDGQKGGQLDANADEPRL